MILLEGLRYSPWTEKARWALDHHEIPYGYREHVIMAGMPRLRWAMRKPFGPITVPVLLLGSGKWVMDSSQIAFWADQKGRQPTLFPSEKVAAIHDWNDACEDATDAARGAVLIRIAKDREALAASLPPLTPKSFTFLAQMGASYVAREFNTKRFAYEQHREKIREFCRRVRGAIGSQYLLGEFTYADVTVASSLNVLRPVGEKFLKVKPAIRAVWTDEELASEFEDLLGWRDRIYELHRKPRLKT